MSCRDIQDRLSTYLDREVGAADQKEVRLHLDLCAACRAEEQALLQVKEQLRQVKMPSLPAGVIAAIEAETVLKPRWYEGQSWRRLWTPLAIGAVAAGALWYAWQSQKPLRHAPLAVVQTPAASSAPAVALHQDQLPDPDSQVH